MRACFVSAIVCTCYWCVFPQAYASPDELMSLWSTRASRLDCVYVEGTVDQFRVPVDLDPSSPTNWRKRPKVCQTVDFVLWLRRPDFRINVRVRPDEDDTYSEYTDFSWVDGRMTTLGGIGLASEYLGGSIVSDCKTGRLAVEPFLTPLEYHFFDFPGNNVPEALRACAYKVDGRTILLQLNEPAPGQDLWAGAIEFGLDSDYVPRRMTLRIAGESGRLPVEWECVSLATQKVGEIEAISEARIVLYNPEVLAEERVVYHWRAKKLVQRPILLGELEVDFPKGTPVADYTRNIAWKAGEPDPPKPIDPQVLQAITESVRAQLGTPAIQGRRQRAIILIVGGAAAVSGVVFLLAWRIRRLRFNPNI